MDQIESANYWFANCVKGKKFKRKNGNVIYIAFDLEIDTSYLRHYGFVQEFIKMRDLRSDKVFSVTRDNFTYKWTEVEDGPS